MLKTSRHATSRAALICREGVPLIRSNIERKAMACINAGYAECACVVEMLDSHIQIADERTGEKDNNGNMILIVLRDHRRDKGHIHYRHVVISTFLVRRTNQREKVLDQKGGTLPMLYVHGNGHVELLP